MWWHVITQEVDGIKKYMESKRLLENYTVTWLSTSEDRSLDFALLSLADSAILSPGTYGILATAIYGNMKEILNTKGDIKKFRNNLGNQSLPSNLIYLWPTNFDKTWKAFNGEHIVECFKKGKADFSPNLFLWPETAQALMTHKNEIAFLWCPKHVCKKNDHSSICFTSIW